MTSRDRKLHNLRRYLERRYELFNTVHTVGSKLGLLPKDLYDDIINVYHNLNAFDIYLHRYNTRECRTLLKSLNFMRRKMLKCFSKLERLLYDVN